MNGSFFFTIFPYEKYGAENWASVFKSTLERRRFKIPFMYSGTDGRAVRLVFSVYHEQNPIITTKGLGQLISNAFIPLNADGSRPKTFIPVLRLDMRLLPIVISHVAKLRVTTNPEKDEFNTANPITCDAGDAFYAMFVQLIRATSCARMIRGLYQSLRQPLKDEFKRETQRCMGLLGIEFNFDWAQEQWDNVKMCNAVSLLIQVRLSPRPITSRSSSGFLAGQEFSSRGHGREGHGPRPSLVQSAGVFRVIPQRGSPIPDLHDRAVQQGGQ
jgi:hypothetical protein